MLEHVEMSDLGASEAFSEIGSDPYGEWEEDGDSGLDFCVNLNNMPCSSWEVANSMLNEEDEKKVNTLHGLDSVEETDSQCNNFLEDTFVLPAEIRKADDNEFKIMDVACDGTCKSE